MSNRHHSTPVFHRIRSRWQGEGGYREVLNIALPLILSTSAWSIQHFVDRMFLSWFSPEAIAASMPAGLLNYTFMCLFMGTAGYVSTFIAQYYGAGRDEMIGKVLFQAFYITLVGGVFMLLIIPIAPHLFRLAGHRGLVLSYEVTYFQILCAGSFPPLAAAALSGFYNGLGRTRPVMWVTIGATLVNIGLDYLLIFGKCGLPRWGVKGAALATVASGIFSFICYAIMVLLPQNVRRFKTRSRWQFQPALCRRLIHYGLPTGIQYFLDIAGFTTFLLLVGRLGTNALAATNITFNINNLAFMPMIGFGIAVSILTGQNLGRERVDLAERATYSALHLTSFYMGIMITLYLLLPEIFIKPFIVQTTGTEYRSISQMVIILLRFVAFYSIFDIFNLIFSGALKGAGDTRFVMVVLSFLSMTVLIFPSYLALVVFQKNLFYAWGSATIYISALGLVFYLRFLQGKWKAMRVIEPTAPILPTNFPAIPTPD